VKGKSELLSVMNPLFPYLSSPNHPSFFLYQVLFHMPKSLDHTIHHYSIKQMFPSALHMFVLIVLAHWNRVCRECLIKFTLGYDPHWIHRLSVFSGWTAQPSDLPNPMK